MARQPNSGKPLKLLNTNHDGEIHVGPRRNTVMDIVKMSKDIFVSLLNSKKLHKQTYGVMGNPEPSSVQIFDN
jgi:hypothetical protein